MQTMSQASIGSMAAFANPRVLERNTEYAARSVQQMTLEHAFHNNQNNQPTVLALNIYRIYSAVAGITCAEESVGVP